MIDDEEDIDLDLTTNTVNIAESKNKTTVEIEIQQPVRTLSKLKKWLKEYENESNYNDRIQWFQNIVNSMNFYTSLKTNIKLTKKDINGDALAYRYPLHYTKSTYKHLFQNLD